MHTELFHTKEILIKQFLFTEQEIEEDLRVQKKLIQLQKIINPGSNQKLDVNLIDIEDMLEHMPGEIIQTLKKSMSVSSVAEINEKDLISTGLPVKMGTKNLKVGKIHERRKEMIQSQRISTLKKIKEQMEEQEEENELDEIKNQSIKGLTSQKFKLQSNMQSKGCLSCFLPYYNVQIQINIDKVLYYPDETVRIEIAVDNRQSERRI